MLPQVKLDEGAIATGGSRGRHATFDEARGLARARRKAINARVEGEFEPAKAALSQAVKAARAKLG